ncbi:MAG: VWA domain-containing protein, partial [Planctomycetes bacterium]|nr:VWA domain-containing protein [Planctomycetota bacterium]
DPRPRGNKNLACILPKNIARRAAAARAEDFIVYVYPLGFSRAEGMTERYRAGGLFLWRSGQRIFIDARVVPLQDRDGPAEVRVLYAPANEIIAEGVADGVSRFSSDLVDVVLAVDVSGSMAYNDPRRRRVVAARTFIELAREGGGIGRIGLVTFNHLAEATSPLMPLEQSERLLSALSGVSADGMTNLDHALRLSMRELFSVDSKQPVIILLTDGKNEGTRYQNSHLECARNGVRLFTVGLTESADHRLLKEMADSTGGIYFRAPTDRELPEIYAQLAAELGKRQLMYAERLRTPSGQMTLPIDATVKRLAAMVDGGAKLSVFGPGGAQTNGRSMESVYLGRPTAGAWNFSWSQATPNASALALFGDTQFFLDVFPPQLRGGKLAIGATLAQGARALPNAKVWIEPLAGVIAERTELFENGRYGPGVYGAVIDIPETGPDRFDLTLRASGIAWDAGDFVRQAVGLTIRYKDVSPVPEDVASASLEGDLDFGVLFPGEAGTALAKIDLDANEARDLFFELSWDTGFDRWPRLSSNVAVEPGKHSFELQIQIPETAEPGDYRGEFSISDGDAIDDKSLARVKVGTVRFAAPGEIDLGLIPRGTFAVRKIHLLSDADKAAPLEVEFDSNGELALLSELDTLPDGKGEIPLEARVTVPIDKPAGDYFASASIRAGPGWVELPFRWRVEAYSIKADTFRPLIGLPPTPELPSLSGSSEQSLPPVDQVDEFFIDAPSGYDQALSYSGDESPWEMTDKIFRERDGIGDRQSDAPSALGLAVPGLRLPEIESPKIAAGDSIWNAWWVYLLAILLLLLLLLLLLAYILYRLGKSALARFLLISTLANLILLAIFIALLSTSLMISPDTRPAISVNLIEDEPQATPGLTEAERVVLIASSQSGTSATGSGVSVEEVFFAGSAAGGNDQQLERAAELPAQVVVEADLAEAAHQTVVPLENRELSALRRRERQLERRESPQPNFEQAEMDEPPPDETGKLNNANPEVDEQRLEFPVEERQEQPAWLDGERPSRLLASSTGLSLGEMPGMEAVGFNAAAGRVEPQDRPRPIREAMFTYPEPRVEIMDPIREAVAWAGDGVNNDSVGGIRARDYESDRDERRFDAAPAAALTIAAGSDRDRQVAFGKAVFADAPAGTASAAEPFQGGGVVGRVLNAHPGRPSGQF